jgi:carboxyl-terminal processing protease
MRKNYFVVLLLIFSAAYGGFLIGKKQLRLEYQNARPAIVLDRLSKAKENPPANFSTFWIVWDKLNERFVDKTALNSQRMVYGAISGMVAALGDPFTAYFPPKQNGEAKEDLSGQFQGVGIQIDIKDKQLVVVAPIVDSPAEKAGIKAGDAITKIDEKSTEGMSAGEAVGFIKGPKGTKVALTVNRAEKEIIFDLTRAVITVRSVSFENLERNGKKYAWIKLTKFGDLTQSQWLDVVAKVDSRYQGIILDLRNNPGGYLEGAVYVAGEFLPSGKLVVSQQSGGGQALDYKVDRNGRLLKQKLAVLINGGSASASEILAGALQDYGRAKIVGEKSFGKGSVQQPEDLPDGSGIHITIAKWLRPSGEWIDKRGITPDIVATESAQLEKAIQLL